MNLPRSAHRRRIGMICVALILITCTVGLAIWFSYGRSADEIVEQAQVAFKKGDYSGAINRAQRAISLDPRLSSAWKLLAESASRNGDLDQTCDALEQYARLRPEGASHLGLRFGKEWVRQMRVRHAIKALHVPERSGIEEDVTEALQLQGEIAALTGHSREVVRCVIGLLKHGVITRDNLLLVASISPILIHADALQSMLKADPSNRAPALVTVVQDIDANRVSEAERLLVEITTAHPDDVEAQGMLADLYAVSLPDKFLAWHSKLPLSAADDARVWSARGKWLSHAGKIEPAIRCLHEALVREPEHLSSTILLGQLLKSVHETELGNSYSERGRKLQNIGDFHHRLKEPRAREFIVPIIDELEATGRLWEAWGWCVLDEEINLRRDPAMAARKARLKSQLYASQPRTNPDSVPGRNFSWDRFPLPDWTRIESDRSKPDSILHTTKSAIRFENHARQTGLDFQFASTYSAERGRRVYESNGAGVAVLDYDLDGYPDLYFPQGKPLPLESTDGPTDILYRNMSGKKFLSVTESARIQEMSFSQGVTSGDFDNDGFPDVYVANFGRNCLYRNNGDGTFSDVTDEAGLKQALWTSSCAIVDLNGDGLPELVDVNYAEGKDLLTKVCIGKSGQMIVCRPTIFYPSTDTICMNLGDGRFQEMQAECGLDLPAGMGLGLIAADFNDDDALDMFIANDMTANYLLINDHVGPKAPLHFHDEAFLRGVALDGKGHAEASMGVTCADINRDGQLDLFVTNFYRETCTLYVSQPGGDYHDETMSAGLYEPSIEVLGFGTQFIDADRDGWHDLVVLNGHVDRYPGEPYQMKAQCFQGLPNGKFAELLGRDAGSLFDEPRLGRGLALLDWNRDGRTDFVATDLEGPVVLGVNQTESSNHSLRLKLIGTQGSRDAIGAKVKVLVTTGDERIAQLTAGDGYEASNERLVEIGIGELETVSRVEIKWPSGKVAAASDVAAKGEWLIIEGRTDWLQR